MADPDDHDANMDSAPELRPTKTQGLENQTFSSIWKELATNPLENGDVVVPARLVGIIMAFSLAMEETQLKLNAMEAQLKLTNDSSLRLERLERQIQALSKNQVIAPVQQTTLNGLPPKPMSWSTAAKAGLQVTSSQAPQAPPPNKAINAFRPSQVIIRSVKTDGTEGPKPFDGMKPTEIVRRVNQALDQLGVKVAGRKLEVKGAASLPSGSVKLFTSTRPEADWLLEHRAEWSMLADPALKTSPAVFPVVIDSVPTDSYPETNTIKQVLIEQNPIQEDMIHSIRWLSKADQTGQATGSILVNLLDKELMNMMVKGSVYYEGNSLRVRVCKKTRVQCFRCQEPGHISLQCKNKCVCKHCGADHDSRTCPNQSTEPPHCVRCLAYEKTLNPDTMIDKTNVKFAHSASSANCPIRSKVMSTPSIHSC